MNRSDVTGASSREHEHIRALLTRYAAAAGYEHQTRLDDTHLPDVVCAQLEPMKLFIGDATVSARDNTHNEQSVGRIDTYVQLMAAMLTAKTIDDAGLAVATDDEEEAANWAGLLEELCARHNVRSPAGNARQFIIMPLDSKTWMAIG